MRKVLLAATAFAAVVGGLGSANAEVNITDDLTIGGRLRQGVALAYDDYTTKGSPTIGQLNYLGEITSSWRPTQDLTFTGDLWIRGDWCAVAGCDLQAPGAMNYSTPGTAHSRFGYNLFSPGTNPGSTALLANPPANPFGMTDYRGVAYDKFYEDMVRELAVKYNDPNNEYAVKVGRFVRAWGQSDGVRLLDVLQAQDLRQKGILGDADETRIPSLMSAFDLNLQRLGAGAPFEAVGLKDPKLELIYMPESHHDRFTINAPFAGTGASGGLYGLPWPAAIEQVSQQSIPFFGANLHDRDPNSISFTQPTLGGRLKFETLGGEGTLNALHGYQEMPIIKMTGSNLIVGNAYNDQTHAVAVVPLSLAQTIAAVHGAYIPYQQGVFPFAPGAPITAQGYQNIIFGTASGGACSPTLPCSDNINFDLDYHYRRDLIGGSFTRDMVELPLGPKGVTPVLRTEFSYEFAKPFNAANVPWVSNLNTVPAVAALGIPTSAPGIVTTGKTPGFASLITDPAVGIIRRDQASLMVGADYFWWLPFWKDQESSIFTSFQIFTINTPGGHELLWQSPYAGYGGTVHTVQNYMTLLLDKTFDHGRLAVNTLILADPQNSGWALRQRFDFNYFGDNLRPRIELSHYEANPEKGIIGLYQHADNVEFSLTLQF